MTIGLTANLYSAAKDYFLFGQTKFFTGTGAGAVTLSTADTAVNTNNLISPVWDYCPDATVIWTLANADNEWAALDSTCPPTYSRTEDLSGAAHDGSDDTVTLLSAEWATKKLLKFVVIWANPDASCPSICYDGLAAQVE